MFPKIAIIGAGPAGIYTALFLKDFKGEVILFDQNKDVGEKLKMTGGGRMNVTNKKFGIEQFSSLSERPLKHLFKNPLFTQAESLLQSIGVEYVWEKERAILKSQDAIAEVARLKDLLLEQENCSIILDSKVEKISDLDAKIVVSGKSLGQDFSDIFEAVVLSGGGMYRVRDLKSKEMIYDLPTQLGHTVTGVDPSLSPLIFKDLKLRELKGIAFEGTLTDSENKKSIQNDMIITHFGLSGPAVLDFSSFRESEKVLLSFITSIDEASFLNQINQQRQGKHLLRKFLQSLLPKRVADFHLELLALKKSVNIADLSKLQVQQLCQNVFRYEISGFQSPAYPSSWTTKGGVVLDEINVATLESKKMKNVYFSGEIIDCDGLCGGYNISFALVTGKIVAESLKKSHQ